jgi:hypothetical protein
MAGKLEICNKAASFVSEKRITSLDDGTKLANLLKSNYDLAVEEVLEDADWTFAVERKILTPEASTPDWEFDYQFILPANCIRVISASDSTTPNKDFVWQKESRKIVADASKVYIRYVAKITNPQHFSPGFVSSVAARLAHIIAVPMTGSRTLKADLGQEYIYVLDKAKSGDGIQGKPRKIESTRLKDVR